MNYLWELTIRIPQLPCLMSMDKAVLLTVKLGNWFTSDYVNSFSFAICGFSIKCLPIELVPCSAGSQRTWWQTIHVMPRLPVSSIPQCNYNHHEGPCLYSFQAIVHFDPTFIAAHQALSIIDNERLHKSWIMTCSVLEDIPTCCNMFLNKVQLDVA